MEMNLYPLRKRESSMPMSNIIKNWQKHVGKQKIAVTVTF